jgi:hypothetical protein
MMYVVMTHPPDAPMAPFDLAMSAHPSMAGETPADAQKDEAAPAF